MDIGIEINNSQKASTTNLVQFDGRHQQTPNPSGIAWSLNRKK